MNSVSYLLLFASSSNTNEADKEESNEPDYGEDKDQLEEEQEEKRTAEITNQAF